MLLSSISTTDTLIGEISALGKFNKATTSIICKTEVVLDRVQTSYVLHLLEEDAELARRFYSTVGTSLAKTLKELSSLGQTPISARISTRLSSRVGSTAIDEQAVEKREEESFQSLFGLPVHHVLVKECPCSYDKVIIRKGSLYISQQFICFYAKIFAQKTKEKILICDIRSVTCVPKGKQNSALKVTCGKKKVKKFTVRYHHYHMKDLHSLISSFFL